MEAKESAINCINVDRKTARKIDSLYMLFGWDLISL